MPLFRSSIRTISPAFLKNGTSERYMYTLGLMSDALMQKATEAGLARMPTKCDPSFLPLIGADRLIGRGLTESIESYRVRLQRAFESWQLAGSARAILTQSLAYMLSLQPAGRMVSSRYSGNVADLLFVTGATNAIPIVIATQKPHRLSTGDLVDVEGVGGNTNANGSGQSVTVVDAYHFELDGTVGNAAWTGGGYVIPPGFPTTYPPTLLSSGWDSYAAGANTNYPPTHVTVTASPNWDWDSVSQVPGSWSWYGAWAIFYSVAPNQWARPATWAIGASLTIGTLPGSIGLDVSPLVVQSIRGIVAQWKAANTWVRWLIVSFDGALFDPAAPAGMGINPDGTFGWWTKVVAGAYVPSRFEDARYCDGVI